MKKLYLLAVLILAAIFCPEARAYNDNYYYAKCTVGVAEDSKGLGTVYILDNEKEVTEAEDKALDYTGMNSGGSVGFEIHNTPADGYVLSHFTDQNGESYYYPEESSGSNPYMISVFATSTNEAEPSVFNLLAHFVKESDLPKAELAEVVISPDEKFGTFMSPVEVEIPSDLQAYRVVAIENNTLMLRPLEDYTLPAFTPVLLENLSMFDATISATYSKNELPEELPSMTAGLLTGVIEETLVPEGAYILGPDSEDVNEFQKVTDEETFIDAFAAYMQASEATEEVYPINTGSIVSVESVLDNLREGEIYDLGGRKLEKLQKGVNIVGGMKVIVK